MPKVISSQPHKNTQIIPEDERVTPYNAYYTQAVREYDDTLPILFQLFFRRNDTYNGNNCFLLEENEYSPIFLPFVSIDGNVAS